jgi:hypothetical protein
LISLKRTSWRKIRDPCDLIGRFRHTGFSATQGRTLWGKYRYVSIPVFLPSLLTRTQEVASNKHELMENNIGKRVRLAELFNAYTVEEQAAGVSQGSLINNFIDLLFPQTMNTTGQRASQSQREARKAAEKIFKRWIRLGERCAALIGRFGLGILVILPEDITDDE